MQSNKKPLILEICEFSAGICGVWQRVKQESIELVKLGYEVHIFSSNAAKGSNEIAPPFEEIEGLKIKRFPYKKLGGESFMSWNFEKELLELKPQVIIAHAYRHLHTTQALKIAKKINSKIFLVTHAPFVEDGSTRSFAGKMSVMFYDRFVGPKTLNKFDKVIAITQWEIPYLLDLGVKEENIVYIPNGIPNEFFRGKIKEFKGKKIMFFGRISPIKNIEVLIDAFKKLHNPDIALEIVGPVEQGYEDIKKFESQNITLSPPIYSLNDKIKKINESDIFVLPSKREAMPQSLIEAMALGKIVISSSTDGGKEILSDKKNGFLFEINNSEQLSGIFEYCLNKKNTKKINILKKNARKKAEEFKWGVLIKQLEKLF
ncbi:MAG: glycosyltransferase family 4 protein [archaeon]|nr:glycosyltransferase family 4 protein [archaeon]